MLRLLLTIGLVAAAPAPGSPAPLRSAMLEAKDPLAAARASFAAGKYDEAKRAALDANAFGLAGAAAEKLGDVAGACALYEKDRNAGAALRVARCREDKGDFDGAMRAWSEVASSALADDPLVVGRLASFLDKHDLPVVLLAKVVDMPVGLFDDARRDALGNALLVVAKRGGADEAQRALERLLVELPDTSAAKEAAKLPAAQARPAEDLAASVKRANALAERHLSDEVIALLEPKLTATDASSAACEAHLLLGKSYRKLHKMSSARKQLDFVANKCGDDVKKKGAYLSARVAYMGKQASALKALADFVVKWPKDALTDDVLLWLGEAREQAGDVKGAEQAWSKIVSEFSDGDMIHEARFRLAWSRAKSGDVAGARALLDEDARNAGSRVDVSDRALYWRARLALYPKVDALEATSDAKLKEEGMSELNALAMSRPASWYGMLARRIVASTATAATSSNGTSAGAPSSSSSSTPLRAAAANGSITPSAALAGDARFVLAESLVAGGYDDEALLALSSIDLAKATQEDRFAVALLESRAGGAGSAHALLRDAGLALLPGTPSADNALAWSLDWPRAYESAIVAAAAENKVPPLLLFGLAREESAFDADVVSWAGAVGLCQLMPPTAADEAKSKGLGVPSVDALKDPVLNARLGASHIGRRLRGLKHPALAIAAYNAGPAAVAEWNPKGPVDAFVEQIPVDETRNYVKKVAGSWITYAVLDGNPDDVTFPLVLP